MKLATVVAGTVIMLIAVGLAGAQDNQPAGNAAVAPAVKKQTVCPIMGGQVNTNIFADANGKRVYFCCGGCPATFKKDPAKHIAKMEKEGITLDKTPAAAQTLASTTNAEASAQGSNPSMKSGGCCK